MSEQTIAKILMFGVIAIFLMLMIATYVIGKG